MFLFSLLSSLFLVTEMIWWKFGQTIILRAYFATNSSRARVSVWVMNPHVTCYMWLGVSEELPFPMIYDCMNNLQLYAWWRKIFKFKIILSKEKALNSSRSWLWSQNKQQHDCRRITFEFIRYRWLNKSSIFFLCCAISIGSLNGFGIKLHLRASVQVAVMNLCISRNLRST